MKKKIDDDLLTYLDEMDDYGPPCWLAVILVLLLVGVPTLIAWLVCGS